MMSANGASEVWGRCQLPKQMWYLTRSSGSAHSTILRWVTWYVPEFEKRWNRFSKTVGTSWSVDETYVLIKAKWHYLYRAVDKHGKTVYFLLRRDRGVAAAQAFSGRSLC